MRSRLIHTAGVDAFLDAVHANLSALEANLRSLGYRFARPEGPYRVADRAAIDRVGELERRHGPIPPLVRGLYSRFESINFAQDPGQLHGPPGDPVAGLGWHCPLVYAGIDSCLRMAAEGIAPRSPEAEAAGRTFIPTGGYVSNCDPVGFWTPDATIDPVIYDEGLGPITLSRELTLVFHAGGFPFWKHMFRRGTPPSPLPVSPDYGAILPVLKRNLLPL